VPHFVFNGNSGIYKKVLSSGTFPKLRTWENFATAYRSSNVEKGGRSERDKLDRRRSTMLTIHPSADARPLSFIAEIVKLCLQRDFVARVHLRHSGVTRNSGPQVEPSLPFLSPFPISNPFLHSPASLPFITASGSGGPQSRRQVHDVLSAAESVRPISDSEVTCGPKTRPATLSSSATSSSNSTDFSSSSSSRVWGSAIAPTAGPGGAQPPNAFCAVHSPKSANLVKVSLTYTRRPYNMQLGGLCTLETLGLRPPCSPRCYATAATADTGLDQRLN